MIKKAYKTPIRNLLLAIIVMILFVVVLLVIIPKNPPELILGSLATDFCNEKCDGKSVYSSNNNSKYDFIRCECVGGIQKTHSEYYGGSDYPIIKVIYFDSQTYQELNKTDVIKRIEGK